MSALIYHDPGCEMKSDIRKLTDVFFHMQVVCERSDVFASACAIARAFPLFTRRSAASRRTEKKHVTVEFVVVDGSPLEDAEMGVLLFEPNLFSFLTFNHIISRSECSHRFCFPFFFSSVFPMLLMGYGWRLALLTLRATR